MKKEKRADRISTFIGADACIDGTIEFKGTIRVDGQVKGNIVSKGGTVVIGEKAAVDAHLDVDVAVVMGQVNGTINAKERIEVYPPGRVGGDIQAPVVSIEPGGLFNGSCIMKMPSESAGKSSLFGKKPPAVEEPKPTPSVVKPDKEPVFTEIKSG